MQELLNDIKPQHQTEIKQELQKIMNRIQKYWLKEKEIEEFTKNNTTIHLKAIEIPNRNMQKTILKKYGFKFPEISEASATDCKISALAHNIHTEKLEKTLLSQEIRVGLITKQRALEKLHKNPNIHVLKQILKELNIKRIENIRKSEKFYEIYDINIIQQINST